MTTKPSIIVLGIDYSDSSGLAFEEALSLATARTSLHAVHVFDHADPMGLTQVAWQIDPAKHEEETKKLREHVLDLARLHARKVGAIPNLDSIYAHVRIGNADEHIVQLANDLGATMIIIGSHGRRGLRRLLVGSIAERVVRLALCPVLVVKTREVQGRAPVPRLETPCDDCSKIRESSAGEQLFCAEHTARTDRAHLSIAVGDLEEPGSTDRSG